MLVAAGQTLYILTLQYVPGSSFNLAILTKFITSRVTIFLQKIKKLFYFLIFQLYLTFNIILVSGVGIKRVTFFQ